MADTFVMSSRQSAELDHAFERNGWTADDVKWLSKGDNLATILTVRRGTAKIVPTPMLDFVGTATVAAMEESIVLSPEVLRERYNIKWHGDNFGLWFFGKTILPFGGSTLAYSKLTRNSLDEPIIAELGGAIAARTEPIEMLRLIEAQKHGGSGALLVNGYANIFYWEDQIRSPKDEQVAYTNEAGEKVVLRAVGARWVAACGGWSVSADSVARRDGWLGGRRFFSRSSRVPSAA